MRGMILGFDIKNAMTLGRCPHRDAGVTSQATHDRRMQGSTRALIAFVDTAAASTATQKPESPLKAILGSKCQHETRLLPPPRIRQTGLSKQHSFANPDLPARYTSELNPPCIVMAWSLDISKHQFGCNNNR